MGAKQRAMATMTSDLWRAGTAAFLAGAAVAPLEGALAVADLAGALEMRQQRMATLLHLLWCVMHSLHKANSCCLIKFLYPSLGKEWVIEHMSEHA